MNLHIEIARNCWNCEHIQLALIPAGGGALSVLCDMHDDEQIEYPFTIWRETPLPVEDLSHVLLQYVCGDWQTDEVMTDEVMTDE